MDTKSCFHCGIENTSLWRTGPIDKPILCNPCGRRWRMRRTLVNYIPKHGFCRKETLVAAQDKVNGLPLSVKVPRKKRSVLPQYCLTPIGRLHRQLLQLLHEQNFAAKTSSSPAAEENDILIDNQRWMTMASN